MRSKLSEYEFETFVCDHLDFCLCSGAQLIGRQCKVTHGIIDVIAMLDEVYIVELKARTLAHKDIEQVLRYVGDVRELLASYHFDFHELLEPPAAESRWGSIAFDEQGIVPVLIGTGCTENVYTAAGEAGIWLKTWSYDEPTNSITMSRPRFPSNPQVYPAWAADFYAVVEEQCIAYAARNARDANPQDTQDG